MKFDRHEIRRGSYRDLVLFLAFFAFLGNAMIQMLYAGAVAVGSREPEHIAGVILPLFNMFVIVVLYFTALSRIEKRLSVVASNENELSYPNDQRSIAYRETNLSNLSIKTLYKIGMVNALAVISFFGHVVILAGICVELLVPRHLAIDVTVLVVAMINLVFMSLLWFVAISAGRQGNSEESTSQMS